MTADADVTRAGMTSAEVTSADGVMADLTAALDEVNQIADTVLLEGYLLYPYRASAQKNQLRWQFGVLAPRSYAEQSSENWYTRTECLLEPGENAVVQVRMRFLHQQKRAVEKAVGPDEFAHTDELAVDNRLMSAWDEGVPEQVDIAVPLASLLAGEHVEPFDRPATETVELVTDTEGVVHGRLVRTCSPVTGVIRMSASPVDGPYGAVRVRVVVENTTEYAPADADPQQRSRDAAIPASLIAAHTILAVSAGSFVSTVDPPEWARAASADNANENTWPVLAGPEGRSDLILSSPIILPEHPQVAPESPTNLFDGCEIDEILSLRTLTLTDREKAEARGTDARAASIIDGIDNMPPEVFERLHGAIRYLEGTPGQQAAAGPTAAGPPATSTGAQAANPFGDPFTQPLPGMPMYTADGEVTAPVPGAVPAARDPFADPLLPGVPTFTEVNDAPWWDEAKEAAVSPETDTILVGGVEVGRGTRVILHPGGRTDAQDIFLIGQSATVESVIHDVDGQIHLAVSIDADPARDIQSSHGRFRYFRPEEVEVAR